MSTLNVDEDTVEDLEDDLDPIQTEVETQEVEESEIDTPEENDEVVEESEESDDSSEDETQPEAEEEDSLTTANKIDYESRFKGAQRSWQKEREQRAEAERRLQEIEERVRQQEEAKTLDPWSPKSPQNAQFSQTLQKYDLYKQALERAQGEDAQRAVAETFAPMFSEEEKAAIQKHQQHLAQVQRQLATPEGMAEHMRQIVRQELEQEFTQKTQTEQLKKYYSELYAQPENKAVLSDPDTLAEFKDRLIRMGDNPPPDAVEIVLENLRYRKSLSGVPETLAKAKAKELSANEQKRLSKGQAKAERDQGVTSRKADPVMLAKRECAKLGIEWGSNKSFQILEELS